jgi:hypothetical protein
MEVKENAGELLIATMFDKLRFDVFYAFLKSTFNIQRVTQLNFFGWILES